MKIIDGGSLVDVKLEFDEATREVVFPCGCRFKSYHDGEFVNDHPSLDITSDMREDCPLTWKLLGTGRTTGLFQLESFLGKRYSEKLGPDLVEHLGALVALLRPGVLKVKQEDGRNMADVYCDRKNGREEVVHTYESIKEILSPTYGIFCFQESVIKIAVKLAGFTSTDADMLRKAIGKKQADKIIEVGKMFVDGAERVGIVSREEATRLFDDIHKSGQYIFNRSHSIGYALSTFETAYLKAHFPVYFFASYLNGAREKSKPLLEIRRLVRDMRHYGIQLLTPRFSDLEPKFTTDGVRIRFGLANVGGIGESTIARVIEGLDRDILLKWSWYEFLTKGGASICGAEVVRNAVKAGAMDDYGFARRRLLEEHAIWSELTKTEKERLTELGSPVLKTVPVHEMVEQEAEEPVYEKGAMKKYKEEVKGGGSPPAPTPIGVRLKKKKVKVQVGEEEIVVDAARESADLEEGLEGLLARPGAVSKVRREKVESLLDMLRNPPSPLVDTTYLNAKQEMELMGVALTTSNAAKADKSFGDTSVLEYLQGANEFEMTIVGEVVDVNEKTVRSGANEGRKWADFAFDDGDDLLEDVVAYSAVWEQYSNLLMRPGAVVAITGKRHWENGKTFVVNEVSNVG